MKICDPSSITKYQNISFLLEAGSFSSFQHFPFIENFKCIHLLCVSHFDNTNFSKCSSSNYFENFKVFFAQPQRFYFVGHRFYWNVEIKRLNIVKCLYQKCSLGCINIYNSLSFQEVPTQSIGWYNLCCFFILHCIARFWLKLMLFL